MRSANLLNTKQRWMLLGAILRNPKHLTKQVMIACRSQGGLAKLHIEEKGISSLSLNTLKASALIAIETQNGVDGWQQLEERRLSVHALASELEAKRKSKLKESDESKLLQLQEVLNKSNRERLRVIKAYLELLRLSRGLAESDDALAARLTRHLNSFSIKNLLVIDGSVNERP